MGQPDPTTIYEDNQSAINLAEAPSIGTKSKHILLRFHYTKEAVLAKQVTLEYINTLLQRADSLTKAQTKPSFLSSVNTLLNISSISTSVSNND